MTCCTLCWQVLNRSQTDSSLQSFGCKGLTWAQQALEGIAASDVMINVVLCASLSPPDMPLSSW